MTSSRSRALVACVAAALVAAALTGCGAPSSSTPMSTTPRPEISATPAPTPSPVDTAGSAPGQLADAGTGTSPVRIRIPSIKVDSALQPLGLTATGELEPPSQWQRAGWYSDGVRPGQTGPAVIAGHVDSLHGPAVFYRLDDLRPGASVYVTRTDGTVLHFVVDRTQEFPKRQFPTEAVYGPTSLPLLRLVTCTGDFDASARSYVDNLVVTTRLVST